MFGQSKYLLRQLASKYGSEQAAYKALQDAVVRAIPQQMAKVKANGVFEYVEVIIDGQRVLVNGRIIDGVVRTSTAWVPK